MKRQPHRLPREARHGFGGAAIDRDKPLSFRLNGIACEAFEGDTVLSALLAAGVDTAGLYHGEPGGKRFRRILSEKACRPGAGVPVILEALAAVEGLEKEAA